MKRIKLITSRRLAAGLAITFFLFALCSCGLMEFVASPFTSQEVGAEDPKSVLPVETEDIFRFGWLSIFLVLVFPKVREPLVNLWTSIFRALAIPFVYLRERFDGRGR
jgi:hypothetical protein